MSKINIGFLHPGAMGISLAASAQNSGHNAYWVSKGRSPETLKRANQYNLFDAKTLDQLCATCSVIISICPPAAAESVARQVLATGFTGLFLDANAISPRRVQEIQRLMQEASVTFVDGSVIGGPAWEPGKTWLYLAGQSAPRVAECFSAGPLETFVLGEVIGQASALKMCYAAYTKGTTALLSAILATAEKLGVRQALETQWSREGAALAEDAIRRTRRVTAKAWRFAREMQEISDTFHQAGLPGEFHAAAYEIYQRMSHFKDRAEMPTLEEVLTALLDAG